MAKMAHPMAEFPAVVASTPLILSGVCRLETIVSRTSLPSLVVVDAAKALSSFGNPGTATAIAAALPAVDHAAAISGARVKRG